MREQYTLKRRHYEHQSLRNIDITKLYDPDSVVFSLVLNLVNTCFEQGEKIFIDIFRELFSYVDSPSLIEQMKIFIYQEANHSLLHREYSDSLRRCDSPTVNVMLSACDEYESTERDKIYNTTSLRDKLYFVIVREIFASNFSKYFLTHYQDKYRQLDPCSSYMYMMHSIEEIEHQCLAFDLYQYLFKEHPHDRECNVKYFKDFTWDTKKRFTSWAVLATQSWCAEKKLAIPNTLEITSELTGESGLFPNGEICGEFYSKDFHPSQLGMRHFVDRWESEWQPDLLKRMQQQSYPV